MARVTAVVVTYRSGAVVGHALRSLRASLDAGLLEGCVVVDNRSGDGTADVVRRDHPWCTVVESPENLGFGRACNVGIERSSTPYVLLLNPDATLPPEGLARLIASLDERPRAGAVAPAVVEADGRLQDAGDLPTPASMLRAALGLPTGRRRWLIQPGGAPFRVEWVCGAVVLMRRALLESVGAFDPRFFLYFEETDLWQRARDHGWELWAVGEAVATHLQGASARKVGGRLYHGCLPEHYFRSRFTHLAVHFGWRAAVGIELADYGAALARAGLRAARGRALGEVGARLTTLALRRPGRPA